MKPHYYHCEIYNIHYYFFIGWSHEDFTKYIKKKFDVAFQDNGRSGLCASNDNWVLVWVRDAKNTSAIVHECVHAANMGLKHVGVKACFDNDEAQTYLIEHLFKEATK